MALVHAVAVAEGVAVQGDVADHPGRIGGGEQVPGPAAGLAAAGRGRVLAGRAQRGAAEVVRQLPAEAHFTTEIRLGFQVADRAAVVADRIPAPAAGIHAGIARPAAHALVGVHEHRFVVQLVVPALEFLVAQQVVHRVLHLLALCPGADHAHRQQGGLQAVAAAGVVAEAGHKHAGVGAVILDQILAAEIGGREDALGQAEDHVLLFELARVQALQVAVHPARHPRQAGIVGVVHQVGRYQGQLGAVGVALVLVLAAEQVVVDAEIDLRRVFTHRIRTTLGGGEGGQGQGSGHQAGKPEGGSSTHGWDDHQEGDRCLSFYATTRYSPACEGTSAYRSLVCSEKRHCAGGARPAAAGRQLNRHSSATQQPASACAGQDEYSWVCCPAAR